MGGKRLPKADSGIGSRGADANASDAPNCLKSALINMDAQRV